MRPACTERQREKVAAALLAASPTPSTHQAGALPKSQAFGPQTPLPLQLTTFRVGFTLKWTEDASVVEVRNRSFGAMASQFDEEGVACSPVMPSSGDL